MRLSPILRTFSGRNFHDMMKPLPYKELNYNSVEMDVESCRVSDTAEFGTRLWSTVTTLRDQKKDAVFLKVPALFAHYIQVAA